MLSFRNKLVKTDPEVIRQIAASTGFFDRQDVQINVEIAENLLNQKDSEHKFLFADYMDKTVAYVFATVRFPMPKKELMKFIGSQP